MSQDQPSHKRKIRLVHKGLQLRFIGFAALFVVAALLVQGLGTAYILHRLAGQLPNDSMLLTGKIGTALSGVLSATLVVLLPLVVSLGLLFSHRIAGPVYRFHKVLRDIANGGPVETIRLRSNDELKDLALVLNEALVELERRPPIATDGPEKVAA